MANVTDEFLENITDEDSQGNTVITDGHAVNLRDKTLRELKNEISTYELFLISAMVGACQIATTGTLDTRIEAIEAAEAIYNLFTDITNKLDESQVKFENLGIDFQYFSQSQAYQDLALLVAKTTEYLLLASYDLKIEKKFILSTQRTPTDIAITEYGTLGKDDENLDFFIKSNKLKSIDILLLQAGREVVVYV